MIKHEHTTDEQEMIKCMLLALSEIKKHKENQGIIECPKCKGKLHFTRAKINGHVWGKCETDDCLSWMQ
jgi:hypothetical protein